MRSGLAPPPNETQGGADYMHRNGNENCSTSERCERKRYGFRTHRNPHYTFQVGSAAGGQPAALPDMNFLLPNRVFNEMRHILNDCRVVEDATVP